MNEDCLKLTTYFGERDPHFAKKLAGAAGAPTGTATTTSNPYG